MQQLDCDTSIQPLIVAVKHLAHSATTNGTVHPVPLSQQPFLRWPVNLLPHTLPAPQSLRDSSLAFNRRSHSLPIHFSTQPRQCLVPRRLSDDPIRPLARGVLDCLLELVVVEVQFHEVGITLGILGDDVVETVVCYLPES